MISIYIYIVSALHKVNVSTLYLILTIFSYESYDPVQILCFKSGVIHIKGWITMYYVSYIATATGDDLNIHQNKRLNR